METSGLLFGFLTLPFFILELFLLTKYSKDQYNNEVVLEVNKQSGAIFTIGFNICLALIFCLFSSLPCSMLGKTKNVPARESNKSCIKTSLFLASLFALVFLFSSFVIHCIFKTCFTSETPLYIVVLVSSGIVIITSLILVVGLSIKYCFCNSKYAPPKVENIDEERKDVP